MILKTFLVFITLGLIICNTRLPLVGIVAVQDSKDDNVYTTSSVDAKTVRWLEASGADSVVIQPWMTEQEIDEILTKINGVVFQSGSVNYAKHNDYVNVANYLFDKIVKLANVTDTNKTTIPILGIDTGLRTIHFCAIDEDVSGNFVSLNRSIPLNFNSNFIKTTKLFSLLNNQDLSNLASRNITFHNHKNGIEPEVYDNNERLNKFFSISSLAKDENGNKFIASVEANQFSIFGVQFRPEVVSFERSSSLNVNHSVEAVRISRALGNAFVQICKNSNSNLMNLEELSKYNYIDPYTSFPVKRGGEYVFVFSRP